MPSRAISVSEKARESRLRRLARRQNLVLMKSRRRNPLHPDYGKYWLMDARRILVNERGGSLDRIDSFLAERDTRGR